MAQYMTFVALVLYGISLIACQKPCIIKDRAQFNFSCDVHAMNATNITWSLFSPEENKTYIINICETSLCHPITPNLANVLLWASADSDDAGLLIQTITLYGKVSYTNLTKLATFRLLQCHYRASAITVCDSFEVYADISKLNWDEFYVSPDYMFMILQKTDILFPAAECTLHIDNETVQSNSSLLIRYLTSNSRETMHNLESRLDYSTVTNNSTTCLFVISLALLGHKSHQFQISAAVNTSDPARAVVSTGVISVNFKSFYGVRSCLQLPRGHQT